MKNNRIEQNSNKCVGCGNCENICPKAAIKMVENADGFLAPLINDSLCVNCGKCINVCQMYKKKYRSNITKLGYVAITKDKDIYRNAASGGAFGTIAKQFLKRFQFSYVAGATYINGKVKHILINDVTEIKILQNSKYVQSNLEDLFIKIRKLLEKKEYVLFSGTPCQVEALYKFLGKDYITLFTIDIICHGVPSQQFLKRDLELYSDNISNIKFRLKKRNNKSRSRFIIQLYKDNQSKPFKYIISNRDPYYALFMENKSFRNSCYSCEFANLNRVGDITIGDCDSYKHYEGIFKLYASSSVLINTKKGLELWKMTCQDFEFTKLNIDKEAQYNTQLQHSSSMEFDRLTVLNDINSLSAEEMTNKYAKPHDIKEKLLLIKLLF